VSCMVGTKELAGGGWEVTYAHVCGGGGAGSEQGGAGGRLWQACAVVGGGRWHGLEACCWGCLAGAVACWAEVRRGARRAVRRGGPVLQTEPGVSGGSVLGRCKAARAMREERCSANKVGGAD
jgi:hypothetical protein